MLTLYILLMLTLYLLHTLVDLLAFTYVDLIVFTYIDFVSFTYIDLSAVTYVDFISVHMWSVFFLPMKCLFKHRLSGVLYNMARFPPQCKGHENLSTAKQSNCVLWAIVLEPPKSSAFKVAGESMGRFSTIFSLLLLRYSTQEFFK